MLKLAQNISRLGTESVFQVMSQAKILSAEGHDVINLSIGQPDFPTPPHVVEAGIQALRDGHHGYTLGKGILEVRQAVAEDLQRRHEVSIDPELITITPGGKVVMYLAIMMFAEAGAEIITPDPAFPIYRSLIDYGGAKAVPLPILEENDFTFKAEDIEARITDKTRLIILNTPANPTGGVTLKQEMDKLAKLLEKHPDIAILSDEIYSCLLYDNHQHHSMLKYPALRERVIMLDGWSKTYAMTGWRLGYGVWPKTLIDIAERLCVNIHSCVNASAQWAGKAALEGSQDCVAEMHAAFDKRRHVITERLCGLKGMHALKPKGSFYSFANIKETGLDAKVLQDKFLQECYVSTVAGDGFGEYGKGYLRISYANSEDNINKAMDRIQKWLTQNT